MPHSDYLKNVRNYEAEGKIYALGVKNEYINSFSRTTVLS